MKRFFLILCLAALASCGSDDDQVDCSNALPAPNWFEIGFVDQTGQSLIGTLFVQDSFKLEGAGTVLYLKPVPFGTDETLLVPFTQISTGASYVLELDSENSEQLRIDFETRELPCGFEYIIEGLFYNGELFSDEDQSVYLLPKPIDP